ncbi:MAG: hypothetical protein E7A55_14770 [Clostridium perfringens]|nr:hypothetical protein [Clostridium perfringens]
MGINNPTDRGLAALFASLWRQPVQHGGHDFCMDHPWRRLRHLNDWLLEWGQLPEGISGEINWPTHTITIDPRLSQAQRRCALAHELEHVMRGPAPKWDEAREEAVVERTAARRLVSIDELASAVQWTRDPVELAEELWIDADMLSALVDGLTPSERAKVNQALM